MTPLELAGRCRERLRELEEHPWPSEIKPLLKFAEQRLARAVRLLQEIERLSDQGISHTSDVAVRGELRQEIRALAEALGVDDAR